MLDPLVPIGAAYARNVAFKAEEGATLLMPDSFAGSVTAALFLRRFAGTRYWAHFDVYGWTPSAKPGRFEGGEVLMAHDPFNLIAERFARGPIAA